MVRCTKRTILVANYWIVYIQDEQVANRNNSVPSQGNNMAKIRAGVVGLQRGNGITHSLQMHPQVEITALCDINTNRLGEIARTFSVPDNQLYDDYNNFLN